MSNVYVVWCRWLDDLHETLDGVFSTQEKAEEHVESNSMAEYCYLRIEEEELK